jgi:hypothetical protein
MFQSLAVGLKLGDADVGRPIEVVAWMSKRL